MKKKHVERAADIYLTPPVLQFRLLQLDAIDAVVGAGYDYCREALREVQV